MEKLGIFCWMKHTGIRTVPEYEKLFHHYNHNVERSWLAYEQHTRIGPSILGEWNDEIS